MFLIKVTGGQALKLEHESWAKQLNRKVISKLRFHRNHILANTCSVRHRIKLEISHFDVISLTGENKEKDRGTYRYLLIV